MTHMFETIAIAIDRECQPPLRAEGHRRLRGALVVAAEHAAAPGAVGLRHRRRQDAGRHRQRSARLRRRSTRSGLVTIVAHRSEMGTGVAHQPADGRRRRDGSRLGARARSCRRRATRRNTATRTPTARAACATSSSRCAQCGAAMRQMLEQAAATALGRRRSARSQAREPRGRAQAARASKLGYGELAAAAMRAADAAARQLKLKDAARLPLHRQGQRPDRRSARHHHGQGRLRHRRQAAGHEVRRRSRARRWSAARSTRSTPPTTLKVPGVEKVGRDRRAAPPPSKFMPLGGIAVVAQQHLGGDQGPRRAEDRLGRRPDTPATTRRRYKAKLEETAAQARQGRAQRGRRRGGAAVGGEGGHGASTTSRIWRMRRWSRRRDRACRRRQVRGLGAGAEPRRHARRPGQAAGHADRERDGQRDAAGRRVRPQVEVRLRAGSGAAVQGDGRRAGQARRGPARTTSSTASTTPSRSSASTPGSTRNGKVVAWRHRSVAPTICSTFKPDPKHEQPFELGMGLVDVPFDIPNLRCENGEARRIRASAGSARCPTSRTPSRCSRSSRSSPHALGPRPEGLPARADRAADASSTRADAEVADYWNYGDPLETFPIDTGRLRRVVELAADKAGLGQAAAAGRRASASPSHRSFLTYVATVVAGRGRRQGHAARPAGRHRDRLRLRRQSGAHPLADRRGGGDGPEPSPSMGEITLQEWPRVEQSNFDGFQVARIDECAVGRAGAHRPDGSTCRPAASASRACRPLRRPCATRSSPPPASASAACRSAIN